jgi:hypothetical protein
MHVEQPPDAQSPVCRALAERNQRQVLAGAYLIGGSDQQVGGHCVGHGSIQASVWALVAL